MRRRVFTIAAVLLSAVVLSWLLRSEEASDGSSTVAVDPPVDTSSRPATLSEPPVLAEPKGFAAPVGSEPVGSEPVGNEPTVRAPVDVDTRADFNEQARAFFANAAQMTAEVRLHEAQQLEQELTRLEQAGGLSAGETFVMRVGLIREMVPAGAQQDTQLQALQERYRAETQRRVATAQARPDPQFGSYKVRESEIVNEVMAMETIPDGLNRHEYLRRRLQSAREQLTPQ
ncbi:MAG: hypothetical protein H7Z40_00145 [Phycisphaerae bacterium]|nr:hypothetical protein [Gemmatimonadaceae bacterium]